MNKISKNKYSRFCSDPELLKYRAQFRSQFLIGEAYNEWLGGLFDAKGNFYTKQRINSLYPNGEEVKEETGIYKAGANYERFYNHMWLNKFIPYYRDNDWLAPETINDVRIEIIMPEKDIDIISILDYRMKYDGIWEDDDFGRRECFINDDFVLGSYDTYGSFSLGDVKPMLYLLSKLNGNLYFNNKFENYCNISRYSLRKYGVEIEIWKTPKKNSYGFTGVFDGSGFIEVENNEMVIGIKDLPSYQDSEIFKKWFGGEIHYQKENHLFRWEIKQKKEIINILKHFKKYPPFTYKSNRLNLIEEYYSGKMENFNEVWEQYGYEITYKGKISECTEYYLEIAEPFTNQNASHLIYQEDYRTHLQWEGELLNTNIKKKIEKIVNNSIDLSLPSKKSKKKYNGKVVYGVSGYFNAKNSIELKDKYYSNSKNKQYFKVEKGEIRVLKEIKKKWLKVKAKKRGNYYYLLEPTESCFYGDLFTNVFKKSYIIYLLRNHSETDPHEDPMDYGSFLSSWRDRAANYYYLKNGGFAGVFDGSGFIEVENNEMVIGIKDLPSYQDSEIFLYHFGGEIHYQKENHLLTWQTKNKEDIMKVIDYFYNFPPISEKKNKLLLYETIYLNRL